MTVKVANPIHNTRAVEQERSDAQTQVRTRRILAAVDGSKYTGLVMKYLIDLQRRQGTIEVVLLNVQPKPQEWRTRGYGWFKREEIEDRLINDLGGRIVRSAGRQLDGAGIPHRDRVEIGEPVEAIVRCAQEEDCGLIVLAEANPGTIRQWLMTAFGVSIRSVASVVVHLATVPILIAR